MKQTQWFTLCLTVMTIIASSAIVAGASQVIYFSTAGNDGNDGLTPSTSLKSLERVPAALATGARVLLKRGDVWYAPTLVWEFGQEFGVLDAPLRIDAWGDVGQQPPAIVRASRIPADTPANGTDGTALIESRIVGSSPRGLQVYLSGRPLRRVQSASLLDETSYALAEGGVLVRGSTLGAGKVIEVARVPVEPLIRVQGGNLQLEIGSVEFRGPDGWSVIRVDGASSRVAIQNASFKSYPVLITSSLPSGRLAPGTYYISSENGNDGNSGTDSTDAWGSVEAIKKIGEWMGPGVRILLEYGSLWYDQEFALSLTNKGNAASADSVMYLGAYGDSTCGKPIIAKLTHNPGINWTNTGPSNRFKTGQAFGDSIDRVMRLYVGGTPLPKVSGTANLVDDTYCLDGEDIYVQIAEASTAPTTETLEYNFNPILSGRNVHNLVIEDIHFKGTPINFGTYTKDVTLSRLTFDQLHHSGPTFYMHTDSTQVHEDVHIDGCLLDKSWTEAMNDEYAHTVYDYADRPFANGAGGGAPAGDGITLVDAVQGAVISGCTVTGFGHTGIGTIYKDLTHTAHGLNDIIWESNVVTAGASNYCRAIGLAGPPLKSLRNIVRRNYFHDSKIISQFAGDTVAIYSNIWDRTDSTSIESKKAFSGSIGLWGVQPSGAHVGGGLRNSVYANNTLFHAGHHLLLTTNADAADLMVGNMFSNNLVVDWWAMPECEGCRQMTAAIQSDTLLASHFTYAHNGFWNTVVGDSVFLVERHGGQVDYYKIDTFNQRANASGNQYADPVWIGGEDNDPASFHLASTSPYRFGGVPLDSILPPNAAKVDFYGNAFHVSPSRGAIQYQWTALSDVDIGGAASPISASTPINTNAIRTPNYAEVASHSWEIKRDGSTQQTGTDSSFSYTPTVNGTYVIKLQATDYLGNVRTADSVTVNVWPDPVIGATIMMGGNPVLIDDEATVNSDVTVTVLYATTKSATRNGSPYAWPGNNVFSASGTYVITATGTSTQYFTFTRL